MLPYELTLIYDGNKQAKEDARAKNEKTRREYASYASLVQADNTRAGSNDKPKRVRVTPGEILKYRIADDLYDPDKYAPWGLTDVNSSINARRIEADERLQIGEVFQVGEIRAVVVNRPRDIWDKGEDHEYQLKSLETGYVYVVAHDDTVQMPTQVSPLMRVNDGVVTNNRDCNITEIGLKSRFGSRSHHLPTLTASLMQARLRNTREKVIKSSWGKWLSIWFAIRFSVFDAAQRVANGSG